MANLCATGYVHRMLDDNQTFEAFVLSCAGNIDYMQHEPSDYDRVALAKAQANVERLAAMDMHDRLEHGHEVKERAIKTLKRDMAACATEFLRCQEMLERVQAWVSPTEDHRGLKNSMIEQLTGAIGDGNAWYEERLARYEQRTPMAWFEQEIADARRTVEYHAEKDARKRERTDNQNRWIAQLRASLR